MSNLPTTFDLDLYPGVPKEVQEYLTSSHVEQDISPNNSVDKTPQLINDSIETNSNSKSSGSPNIVQSFLRSFQMLHQNEQQEMNGLKQDSMESEYLGSNNNDHIDQEGKRSLSRVSSSVSTKLSRVGSRLWNTKKLMFQYASLLSGVFNNEGELRYRINVSNIQKSLPELGEVQIDVNITPLCTGKLHGMIACDVAGLNQSLGIELYGQVMPLTVAYSIQRLEQDQYIPILPETNWIKNEVEEEEEEVKDSTLLDNLQKQDIHTKFVQQVRELTMDTTTHQDQTDLSQLKDLKPSKSPSDTKSHNRLAPHQQDTQPIHKQTDTSQIQDSAIQTESVVQKLLGAINHAESFHARIGIIPTIQFGDTFEMLQRKTIRIRIFNLSGLPTDFRVQIAKYPAWQGQTGKGICKTSEFARRKLKLPRKSLDPTLRTIVDDDVTSTPHVTTADITVSNSKTKKPAQTSSTYRHDDRQEQQTISPQSISPRSEHVHDQPKLKSGFNIHTTVHSANKQSTAQSKQQDTNIKSKPNKDKSVTNTKPNKDMSVPKKPSKALQTLLSSRSSGRRTPLATPLLQPTLKSKPGSTTLVPSKPHTIRTRSVSKPILSRASYEDALKLQSSNGLAELSRREEITLMKEELALQNGIAFRVSPTVCHLPSYGYADIFVSCVGDMPGRYQDSLMVYMDGASTIEIPINATIGGCPLSFEPTAAGFIAPNPHTMEPAGLHFGSLPVSDEEHLKNITLRNTSPMDAYVKWHFEFETPKFDTVPMLLDVHIQDKDTQVDSTNKELQQESSTSTIHTPVNVDTDKHQDPLNDQVTKKAFNKQTQSNTRSNTQSTNTIKEFSENLDETDRFKVSIQPFNPRKLSYQPSFNMQPADCVIPARSSATFVVSAWARSALKYEQLEDMKYNRCQSQDPEDPLLYRRSVLSRFDCLWVPSGQTPSEDQLEELSTDPQSEKNITQSMSHVQSQTTDTQGNMIENQTKKETLMMNVQSQTTSRQGNTADNHNKHDTLLNETRNQDGQTNLNELKESDKVLQSSSLHSILERNAISLKLSITPSKPYLHIDKAPNVGTLPCIKFGVWLSKHPRQHVSYRREITLTNSFSSPLLFSLDTVGPFFIRRITTNAPVSTRAMTNKERILQKAGETMMRTIHAYTAEHKQQQQKEEQEQQQKQPQQNLQLNQLNTDSTNHAKNGTTNLNRTERIGGKYRTITLRDISITNLGNTNSGTKQSTQVKNVGLPPDTNVILEILYVPSWLETTSQVFGSNRAIYIPNSDTTIHTAVGEYAKRLPIGIDVSKQSETLVSSPYSESKQSNTLVSSPYSESKQSKTLVSSPYSESKQSKQSLSMDSKRQDDETESLMHRNRLKRDVFGAIKATFTNGTVQHILLRAELLRPIVTVQPAWYDFGHVHTDKKSSTVLYLTNPTEVEAEWTIKHLPWPKPKTKVTIDASSLGVVDPNVATLLQEHQEQMQNIKVFKESAIQYIDDPSVFLFEAEQGILQGPTAAGISTEDVAIGRLRGELHPPQPITITFDPKENSVYRCRFRVSSRGGEGFEFVVVGRGTYEEYYS